MQLLFQRSDLCIPLFIQLGSEITDGADAEGFNLQIGNGFGQFRVQKAEVDDRNSRHGIQSDVLGLRAEHVIHEGISRVVLCADAGNSEAYRVTGEGGLNLNELDGFRHGSLLLLGQNHIGPGGRHIDFLVGKQIQRSLVFVGIYHLAGGLVHIRVQLL